MRILMCNWKDLAHPRAGGAEVWTQGIAAAWAADGHDVTIACATAPGLDASEERDGVEIVRGGDYRVGVHRHARALYRSRHGKFDLVVDEINTRPFHAMRWADRSQVVAFVHQTAREVWRHETPLPIALAGRYVLEPHWLRAYRRHRVGALSPSTAASLRRIGFSDVFVVPVAADLPAGPPRGVVKNEQPTFVFAGRLSSMKQPLHAIRALQIVQQTVPDARLLIIGAGPEMSRVQRNATRRVEVLGWVSREERDEIMRRAHALVVPSVREGWGLVVSEAAAVGTGAIGYAVPGLVDSIVATGGTLVAPSVAALAEAMRTVAIDPSRAPRPMATGTQPFATVAPKLLASALGADDSRSEHGSVPSDA